MIVPRAKKLLLLYEYCVPGWNCKGDWLTAVSTVASETPFLTQSPSWEKLVKSARPDVWVNIMRRVMAEGKLYSGKYNAIESSTRNRPCSCSFMIKAAVNCLVMEPISKMMPG